MRIRCFLDYSKISGGFRVFPELLASAVYKITLGSGLVAPRGSSARASAPRSTMYFVWWRSTWRPGTYRMVRMGKAQDGARDVLLRIGIDLSPAGKPPAATVPSVSNQSLRADGPLRLFSYTTGCESSRALHGWPAHARTPLTRPSADLSPRGEVVKTVPFSPPGSSCLAGRRTPSVALATGCRFDPQKAAHLAACGTGSARAPEGNRPAT